MNYIVLGFIVVSVLMYVVGFAFFPDTVREGLKITFKTWTDPNIGYIPLIVSATLITSLIQASIPRQVLTSFLGKESGLKGIVIGALLGSAIPGSPYVIFPFIGGLYKVGIGAGTAIAFVSAWSLISIARLPDEIAFLPIKLVAVRVAVSLIVPIVLGILGQVVFSQMIKEG
jgi:uncharacterized membrane protein YraQ (UPF0718 family)